MRTLKKLKLELKFDKSLRHSLVKGTKNEILIDLDGDKQADLAFIDSTNNGNIDTIAIDLSGNGEFDLYFLDKNQNNIPDTIIKMENDEPVVLASGDGVEEMIINNINAIYALSDLKDLIINNLDDALDELYKELKKIIKKINRVEERK